MDQNLTQLRDQIDGIDQKLVELFKQRMAVSREVAAYKQEHGLPTLDAGRERALLAKVGSLAGEDLADYTESVFRSIMAASRSYQKQCEGSGSPVYEGIRTALSTTPDLFPQRATVACQGIEGAYSQIACDSIFKSPTILYFDTFDHVFKAVESGMCQYGILPIENSTAGSVNATYDLMTRHNFSIVRSARLKVSHNLLAKAGTGLPDIKEVFSHEQAINQCSAFLSGLKGVKVTVVPNTAVEDGDEDANYFQHLPYLEEFNETRGTHLVSVAGVHIEPMGIYAGRVSSLEDLPDGAVIAVPNDATNEGRALLLLEAQGLITLDDSSNLTATPNNIVDNPKNLEFQELEAATIPSVLADVDLAVINSNYALGAGLNPTTDALAIESSDSPYVNVLVVKEGNENNEAIQALVDALHSDTIRDYITETFDGAVVPAF